MREGVIREATEYYNQISIKSNHKKDNYKMFTEIYHNVTTTTGNGTTVCLECGKTWGK